MNNPNDHLNRRHEQHVIHPHKEPIQGPYHFHHAFTRDLASPVGVVLAFLLLLALVALIPDFNKWNFEPTRPVNEEPALSVSPPADAIVLGSEVNNAVRP